MGGPEGVPNAYWKFVNSQSHACCLNVGMIMEGRMEMKESTFEARLSRRVGAGKGVVKWWKQLRAQVVVGCLAGDF